MADDSVSDVSHPTCRMKKSPKPPEKKLKSFDEVFKFARETSNNERCEAVNPPKEVIKTDLFMHQKLGLGWLIQRENSNELPPFWIERSNGTFENLITDVRTNKRPTPLRGGVFADGIGLGKTLTLLSLIATDYGQQFNSDVLNNASPYLLLNHGDMRDISVVNLEEKELEEIDLSLSLSVGRIKRLKPSKDSVGSSKKLRTSIDNDNNGNNYSKYPVRRRTTLIVCPTDGLLKWKMQLEEHTELGTLKVFMYNKGLLRDGGVNVEDLKRYDIVLTTYLVVGTAYNSALMKMEWFRVILDDAHVTRKRERYSGNVLFGLKSKNRWLVTGMPICSGSYKLHPFMAFLRFEPFSNKNNWHTLVDLPIQKGSENGLSRLQDIMATISLRRLNGDPLVGLPPKTIETCFLELSVEEREKYDQMEEDCQSVVRNYFRLGREVAQYSTILGIIQQLRQMCNDRVSCLSEPLRSYTIEDVSKNPELLQKMVSLLQDSFDCPICISPLVEPTITCCAHMFCKSCIRKALLRKNPCCPLCRHHLSEAGLFSASFEKPCNDSENNNIDILSSGITANYSSKVSTLLGLLVSSRTENNLTKSVVFSEFTNMLILLEDPLKAAGFEILRLNRLMSEKKKNHLIKSFRDWDLRSSIVLLVDLKAMGSGVHLTTVSTAYLLEPWINPATEEQALNRVCGIGQNAVVKIVRLITRYSIEERILKLHEKKKLERHRKMNEREVRHQEVSLLMAL